MNQSSSRSNGYQSSNASNSSASNSTCNGTKYVIKKGDTLYSISRKYDVPLALVLRANPYVDVYNLQIGQEICIPSASVPASPVVVSPGPANPPVVVGPGPVVQPTKPQGSGPVVQPTKPQGPGPVVRPTKPQEPGPVVQPKPVRQTMPVVERKPTRQTMPVTIERAGNMDGNRVIPRHYVDEVEETPVIRARVVAPVRFITQPAVEESDKEKCGRWCSYQDRERFNTIMNYDDSMMGGCNKKCPENITKPASCMPKTCKKHSEDNDSMMLVSYISREQDTLQDILDYFTMDVADLLQYNHPTAIQLKPGCMIQIPGRSDDI